MKIVKIIVLACTLATCLISVATSEQVLEPEDFAHGYPILTAREAPIYEITLPEDVYKRVMAPGLQDICVFNGLGEPVPFGVGKEPQELPRGITEKPLPLFPLWNESGQERSDLSVMVVRSKEGAILTMKTDESRAENRKLEGYLLDASTLRKDVKGLALQWEPFDDTQLMKVRIEGSEDLEHWTVLVASSTLADMQYGGYHLKQNSIPLPPSKHAYYRLSFLSRQSPPRIISIHPEVVPDRPEPRRLWTQITGQKASDEPQWFHFHNQGYMPVDRIHVELPEKNSMARVSILSRDSDKAEWRHRVSGNVYEVWIDGERLTQPDFIFPPTWDRFWKMEVQSGKGTLGAGVPQMRLGWMEARVLFMARGKGPFLLAFGSGRQDKAPRQTPPLWEQLPKDQKDKLKPIPAALGTLISLGGDGALKKTPDIAWKKWVLWAVLLCGVALMGFMARKLYGSLGSPPRP